MKINVNFSELEKSVAKMGAAEREFILEDADLDPREPIDIELEEGKEVDLEKVATTHGLLSYEGRQILLYIPDHKERVTGALEDGSNGNKYHVSDCKALKHMKKVKRFDRYIATNDLSGEFFISGTDYYTGQEVEGKTDLKVCKYCLTKLNYQGYSKDQDTRKIVFTNFTLEEFFSNYSSYFSRIPSTLRPKTEDYTKDWKTVTERLKKARKYECENCYIDLSDHKSLLHVHHLDTNRKNNNNNNLRLLCCDCARKPPFNQSIFVSLEDTRIISKIRKAQLDLSNTNWADIYLLADPAVHGLISMLESVPSVNKPEVGFEVVNEEDEVIAELELAWPDRQVGVSVTTDDRTASEEEGWDAWEMVEAIEKFHTFRRSL